MILKDASNLSQPIEVARKKLPCSFDVYSSKSRIKEPTSARTQQANIDASSDASLRQPTNCHILSTREPEQQSPSDVQHLPSIIPVFHPSSAPKPPLVQDGQPRHGPSPFAHRPSVHSLRVLTNAEKILARAKVAERQAQIDDLEMKTRDLRANFEVESQKLATIDSQILVIQKEMVDRFKALEAERQKAEAAAMATLADLEVQLHALKQETSYAASVLSADLQRMW